MPRLHKAVASPCQAARPCSAASRCAWWHQSITASAPTGWTGFSASGQGGVPPWPNNRSVLQRRRRAANPGVAPPLRPHAALLHKAAFQQVQAVVPLKLHLVPRTATRPGGFLKQALCKVASTPTCVVLRSGYSTRRFAQVFGQWPAAIHVCQPPPTPGPRRFAALAPRGLPIRPPRGLPQSALQGRGAKPIAGFARNVPNPPSKVAATKDVAISQNSLMPAMACQAAEFQTKKSPEYIRAFCFTEILANLKHG